jgi:OOP family OmpA-OmpF porin
MKKIIVLLSLILAFQANAQEKWSFGLGIGNQYLASQCAELTDNFLHIDGVVRYSFNEKFGIGVYGGYDALSLENFMTKEQVNTDYYRASLEGVVSVLEVVGLNNTFFDLKAHGGFGGTYFSTDTGYNNVLPNLSGGFTGLFKINRRFALKADVSTTVHFSQDMTLNGETLTNVGVNSFITNATIGVVFYPRSKKKISFDWSEKAPVDNTWKNNVINKVRDLERKSGNIVTIPVNNNDCCNDKLNEHIFFSENNHNIRGSELNALVNVIDYLEGNPNANLEIVGQSCYTHGSDRYNLELSKKRAKEVYNKLVSMHIAPSRLTYKGIGRDKRFTTGDNDAQKRVDFFIK